MTRKLVVDIETSPNVVLDFDIYDSKPRSPDAILEPTRTLCFAYKWLEPGAKVQTCAEWDADHETMILTAHNLLSEADAVIHFNGKRFDIKHLNREFAELRLGPPAPFEQIDLYQAVKTKFAFPSSRLAYVSRRFHIASKSESGGLSTWKGVMAGDEKAQAKMLRYNARDVVVTEQLYKEILAWIPSHPNEAEGAGNCPTCNSGKLIPNGYRRQKRSGRLYRRFRCNGCGSWSQAVRSEPETGSELVSVPL